MGGGGESITELREDVTSPCLGGSRLSSPKTTNEIRPFFHRLNYYYDSKKLYRSVIIIQQD